MGKLAKHAEYTLKMFKNALTHQYNNWISSVKQHPKVKAYWKNLKIWLENATSKPT